MASLAITRRDIGIRNENSLWKDQPIDDHPQLTAFLRMSAIDMKLFLCASGNCMSRTLAVSGLTHTAGCALRSVQQSHQVLVQRKLFQSFNRSTEMSNSGRVLPRIWFNLGTLSRWLVILRSIYFHNIHQGINCQQWNYKDSHIYSMDEEMVWAGNADPSFQWMTQQTRKKMEK